MEGLGEKVAECVLKGMFEGNDMAVPNLTPSLTLDLYVCTGGARGAGGSE